MPGKRTSAAFENYEVSAKKPRLGRQPKLPPPIGPGVGVPLMMTQYLLPLRTMAEDMRRQRQLAITMGERLTKARQRDLANYRNLYRTYHDLQQQDAPAEAILAAYTQYTKVGKALELFLQLAKKEQKEHYLVVKKLKRDFKALVVGALQTALVFGQEFSGGEQGRRIWDELQGYKQFHDAYRLPSFTGALNLFN